MGKTFSSDLDVLPVATALLTFELYTLEIHPLNDVCSSWEARM